MIRDLSTGHKVRRFSAALVLPVLVVAGCGGPAATAVPQPTQPNQTNTGTPTVPPTVRQIPNRTRTPDTPQTGASGDMITLDQSYMPFAAGRSWTYNVKSSAEGKTDEGTVTWTVDAASTDNTAVTVASNVGGQMHTVSNKVVKNTDGTVTITTTTDGQSQTQTVKPEDMPQGTDAQAQAPGGGQAGAMQGTKDSITVPAGTFEAVKVVNELPEGKGAITAWYAPDIGMVKQEIQATTDNGQVSSIMELAAYK